MKPRLAAPALLAGAVLVLAACARAVPLPRPTGTPQASRSTPGLHIADGAAYRFGAVASVGKIVTSKRQNPAMVRGISGHVVQVATSSSDGYALTSAGTVWAWGLASSGELGDGQRLPYMLKAAEVAFPPGVRIVRLASTMPLDGGLAIDSRGHVWGWGLNTDGDLCLPGAAYTSPALLPLSDVALATGAGSHSLFYSRGRVYACGSGQFGELGTGSTANSARPAAVTGLPAGVRVTALTASWGRSGALLSNGRYYNWGYNGTGQLGDRSTANSDVPVKVRIRATVQKVSQGGSGPQDGQTLALTRKGTVWAWGNNTSGQLGNGSTLSSAIPVQVRFPLGIVVRQVGSGGNSGYAIDESHRLWVWGGDKDGQLGTGTGIQETKPAFGGIHLSQVSSAASNVTGVGG